MHTHGGNPSEGLFIIECLMAHENKIPDNMPGVVYTFGIHPWFLNENNSVQQLQYVVNSLKHPNLIAIGEAGFDKLRGPSYELQNQMFEAQVRIAESHNKPVIIHCVKAWDELLAAQKKLNPSTLWMIHGFRGSPELANQLLSKGLYLSFWFDFVLRPSSSVLLRSLPKDRIFLETDGADVDIRDIYQKVASDLDIEVDDLKSMILRNYNNFFSISGSPK